MADTRASSIDLARGFYEHHRLAFAKAAQPDGQNQFEFSGDKFDQWAVAAGHMAKRALDTATGDLEHNGSLYERHALRRRLNIAARRGEGLDRAYTIEARGMRWRVVLLERFVVEQPTAIVSGIRRCLERSDLEVDRVNKYLDAQDSLSDEERLLCKMRLEMAQMSILSGHQMMEMVIMGFSSDKAPNWKRLRRRFAEVLLRESSGKKQLVTVRRKRRKPAA
jgi:hypothetical protein